MFNLRKVLTALSLLVVIVSANLVPTSSVQAAQMTFNFANSTPYRLEFQLQSGSGIGQRPQTNYWPNFKKVWFLYPGQTMSQRITCHQGERVCYGAQATNDTNKTWGVGVDKPGSCIQCCFTCLHGTYTPLQNQIDNSSGPHLDNDGEGED